MFTPDQEKRRYVSILADGKFHQSVPEGTEGAVIRTYETSDGKKGTKNELVYQSVYALITGVSFEDGDFGEQLLVTLKGADGEEAIIATNTGNSFAIDIMKKLPNVNFNSPVKIAPYSFEDEKGKNKKGVTLMQNEVKLPDFFSKKEGDKWVRLHGFPEPKKAYSDMRTNDWQLYFLTVTEFLTTYVKENICPQINNKKAEGINYGFEDNSEDLKDAIPF